VSHTSKRRWRREPSGVFSSLPLRVGNFGVRVEGIYGSRFGFRGSRAPGLGSRGFRAPGLGVWDLRAQGLGLRGFRAQGLGLRGFRAQGLGVFGAWVLDFGMRVQGLGFRV